VVNAWFEPVSENSGMPLAVVTRSSEPITEIRYSEGL
jgi:hypothetical protein